MRYYVETWTPDLIGIRCAVNVRADAKHMTLVKKSLQALFDELHRLGLIEESASVKLERPNIWINGGLGGLWISDSKRTYTVSISNEYGAYMYA